MVNKMLPGTCWAVKQRQIQTHKCHKEKEGEQRDSNIRQGCHWTSNVGRRESALRSHVTLYTKACGTGLD